MTKVLQTKAGDRAGVLMKMWHELRRHGNFFISWSRNVLQRSKGERVKYADLQGENAPFANAKTQRWDHAEFLRNSKEANVNHEKK